MTDDVVDIWLDMTPMARLRRSVGQSQSDLARMIGCSRSAVSAYERGTRPMPLGKAVLAARMLGYPIWMFYDVVDVPSTRPQRPTAPLQAPRTPDKGRGRLIDHSAAPSPQEEEATP